MFKLAFKSAVFLLPIILLIGGAEYKARSIPSDYGKKAMIAEQKIEQAEIIAFGASHIYFGIKAAIFDAPALNLAYIFQDFYYDNQILSKLLPRAKNLKTAIISISYASFEVDAENSVESWRSSFYQQFWDIPSRDRRFKLSDYSSIALFGIQNSREYALKNRLPKADVIDATGSNVNPRPINPMVAQKPDGDMKGHQDSMRKDAAARNIAYVSEMIERLQAANVRVILVTAPCFHTYYDKMNPQDYVDMQNNTAALVQKYNVPYYNYLKDNRFDENDFTDSDHLNTPGSEKFTRLIKELIENPPVQNSGVAEQISGQPTTDGSTR